MKHCTGQCFCNDHNLIWAKAWFDKNHRIIEMKLSKWNEMIELKWQAEKVQSDPPKWMYWYYVIDKGDMIECNWDPVTSKNELTCCHLHWMKLKVIRLVASSTVRYTIWQYHIHAGPIIFSFHFILELNLRGFGNSSD